MISWFRPQAVHKTQPPARSIEGRWRESTTDITLPQSEFRQFLPQGETRPSPHHRHTENQKGNRAKQKRMGGGGARAGRHSRSGGTALWAVMERRLWRGGMEITHRTLFWK